MLIAACGKADVPSSKQDGNENILRYDVPAPFTSLNPTEVVSSGSNHVFPLLYSYLFVPDDSGEIEPDLAVEWIYDSERFSWAIQLREDARFHNGKRVTSQDIEYSFESVLKNNRPFLFDMIKRISRVSDTSIRIHLTKNDPGFLKKIWDIEILPHRDRESSDLSAQPLGSGPFRFKSRKGETEVVLEANEDYYRGRPSLDGLMFQFQPDKESSWTRLLSGKTDIVQEISPKNYEMIKQYEKRFYFDLYPIWYYTILLYNTTDPLFSDPRVRRALTHAIDREYVIENILKGFGTIAAGPMGADSPYHNPDLKTIPYDPQKALVLLESAGWSCDSNNRYLMKNESVFEFTILVFEESQIEKKVARHLRLSLNDLGIRVNIELLPFGELKKRYHRNSEFQAVLTELNPVGSTPEALKDIWSLDPSKKSVAGAFNHPEITSLICQTLDEKDPDKQKESLYRIEELITLLQPGTFLFHKTAIDAMSRRFKLPIPFSLTHRGIYHLRHAELID